MSARGWMIVAATMLVALAGRADAAFDADSALAKAHRLMPHVVRNEPGPLWAEFDETMRGALGNPAGFAVTLAGIHNQIGALDSLFHEQVQATRAGTFVYLAEGRFALASAPIEVILAFGADGRVSGLLVRPAEAPRKEHDSPHLNYRTRTPLHLPFDDEWTVFWGGRTLAINYHAFTRDQRFAVDLLIMRDGQVGRACRARERSAGACTPFHSRIQPASLKRGAKPPGGGRDCLLTLDCGSPRASESHASARDTCDLVSGGS